MEGNERMSSRGDIEEKLFTIRYKVDEQSHLLILKQDVCIACPTKNCTHFCPADVYHWMDDHTDVHYENCVECGTCRIGCPYDNISWVHPKGGYGITYKFG